MKVLLLLTLLTSPTFAGVENIIELLGSNVDLTDNCDPKSAPLYCGDLFAQTCSVGKMKNLAGALDTELDQKYWSKLPSTASYSVFNEMAKSSIAEAESKVNEITKLHRENDIINNAFARAKEVLKNFITSRDVLPENIRMDAHNKINSVKLRKAEEYVLDYIAHAKKQGSATSDAELRVQGYRAYQASCGRNGLKPNAFFDRGSIVICPGLFISIHDYGMNKNNLLNAVTFTIGHELGHAIDSSVYPAAYGNMAKCYREITEANEIWSPGLADEISADYWGAVALSERLRTQPGGPPSPQEVKDIIAYATDGFCSSEDDGHEHPPAQFRVNQTIGRHVMITELMDCPAPGPRNPFCSMRGTIPKTTSAGN